MSAKKAKTSTIAAAKIDERNHTTTNFSFLPFVVQLLNDKVPNQGVQPLPINKPEALTLEAVEAVQDISNQAVLAYLARNGGWSKRPYIAYGAERPVEGRLWEHKAWQNMSLSFSECSLDSLLIAYNLTRKAPKAAELRSGNLFNAPAREEAQDSSLAMARKQGQSIKDIQSAIDAATKASHEGLKHLDFSKNGDLLLHHRVYNRLSKLQSLDRSAHAAFLQNPLNLMCHFHRSRSLTIKQLDRLTRLLDSDLEPLFPWLSLNWTKHWIALEPSRWTPPGGKTKALESFHRFNHNQSMLFTSWYALSAKKERPDLLVPILNYYQKLITKHGPVRRWDERFREMAKDLRHVERGEYIDQYVKAMLPALTLRTAYEDAKDLHPIDREAAHHLYMDHYQRAEFEKTLVTIEEFINLIQPKIG